MAETIVWIDPDGVSTTLHETGNMHVAWNVTGRFGAPSLFEEEAVPEMDGARLRSVRMDARPFSLPVWVKETSATELRLTLRELARSMNPRRGDGIIRVTTPVGDQREISCRVTSGLQGSERIDDSSTVTDQLLSLEFRAWDPYWRDTTDTSAGPWILGSPAAGFFPLFPLRLASSEVFATDTVDNLGDVEAWPVWTVTGPGSSITLKNLTTDKTLLLNVTLLAGESVVIDTRPGAKTVIKSDGSNQYSNLSATSSLWSLTSGDNSVQIELGGATSATSVSMLRRHRYLAV